MKISIVIPVYNEALQLRLCLQAIARQSVAPFEVIVIDNNSDDASGEIARSFDFVRVLTEPKQGVVHARTLGFNAARGDIIARIDADTIVADNWIESIVEIFTDQSVDAVSGTASYYGLAGAGFFDSIDLFFRRRLSWQLGNRLFLWGANMALRRDAWLKSQDRMCAGVDIHEDFDLAIHLQEAGGVVIFDERLKASVSSRRVDMSFRSFMHYVLVSPATYAKHDLRQRRHMYVIVALCAVGYLPARLLHRGYDSEIGHFSWSKVLNPDQTIARVDPTTNVA